MILTAAEVLFPFGENSALAGIGRGAYFMGLSPFLHDPRFDDGEMAQVYWDHVEDALGIGPRFRYGDRTGVYDRD